MGLTIQIIHKNDCCNNHQDNNNENLDEVVDDKLIIKDFRRSPENVINKSVN